MFLCLILIWAVSFTVYAQPDPPDPTTVPPPTEPQYGNHDNFRGIKVFLSMVITNIKFNEALFDTNSDGYAGLCVQISDQVRHYYVIAREDTVGVKIVEFSKDEDGGILVKFIIKFKANKYVEEIYSTTTTGIERDVGISDVFGDILRIKPESLQIHEVEKYVGSSYNQTGCCTNNPYNQAGCCADKCCQQNGGNGNCCSSPHNTICKGSISIVVLQLPDEEWDPALENPKSEAFKALADKIKTDLAEVFKDYDSVAGFDIASFSNKIVDPDANTTAIRAKIIIKLIVNCKHCAEEGMLGTLVYFTLEQQLLTAGSIGKLVASFPPSHIQFKPGVKFHVDELKHGWSHECHVQPVYQPYQPYDHYKRRLSKH